MTESAERELPELESQKKLAVQARNFDEAGRVSEEAKKLTAAKEANEAKKAEAEGARQENIKIRAALTEQAQAMAQEAADAATKAQEGNAAAERAQLCAVIDAQHSTMSDMAALIEELMRYREESRAHIAALQTARR